MSLPSFEKTPFSGIVEQVNSSSEFKKGNHSNEDYPSDPEKYPGIEFGDYGVINGIKHVIKESDTRLFCYKGMFSCGICQQRCWE